MVRGITSDNLERFSAEFTEERAAKPSILPGFISWSNQLLREYPASTSRPRARSETWGAVDKVKLGFRTCEAGEGVKP
jgi:hypothetical protein